MDRSLESKDGALRHASTLLRRAHDAGLKQRTDGTTVTADGKEACALGACGLELGFTPGPHPVIKMRAVLLDEAGMHHDWNTIGAELGLSSSVINEILDWNDIVRLSFLEIADRLDAIADGKPLYQFRRASEE